MLYLLRAGYRLWGTCKAVRRNIELVPEQENPNERTYFSEEIIRERELELDTGSKFIWRREETRDSTAFFTQSIANFLERRLLAEAIDSILEFIFSMGPNLFRHFRVIIIEARVRTEGLETIPMLR